MYSLGIKDNSLNSSCMYAQERQSLLFFLSFFLEINLPSILIPLLIVKPTAINTIVNNYTFFNATIQNIKVYNR